MKYNYPLQSHETNTYSSKIADYRRLSREDKKVLVNDFKEFYKYVFWFLNLPHPTRDQLYMSKFLSQSEHSKISLMLQAQRGLAKSLTLQIFADWLLLRNKNEKIVVLSATSGRAESFTKFCLQLIRTIPLLQHLEPTGEDRTSTKKFDVGGRTPDDSPSVCAFGITSAKTGSRATFIIYDDVEIPENSETASKREKILSAVRDTSNLGVANVFRESCICTPQTSESVYDKLVAEDGFIRTIIPAEYPDDITVYAGSLAPHIERICRQEPHRIGQATDARCDLVHLMKQKQKGKARYKLHYMLDTSMSDAEKYPLKLTDLIVMDLDKEQAPVSIVYSSDKKHCLYDIKHNGFRGDALYSPRYISDGSYKKYEGIAMFIDPSGRGKDETTYCVTAQLGGKIFLLALSGFKGGYEPTVLTALSEVAKLYKVNSITVESNFGDGAFAELLKPVLKPIHNVPVEDNRATKQKEIRIIDTLEPVMMQHRLIVDKSVFMADSEVKGEYSLTYQMTHIVAMAGCLKHDDRLDVLEMGIAYWKESLARDEKDAEEKFKKEQLLKQLEEYKSKLRLRGGQATPKRGVMERFKTN